MGSLSCPKCELYSNDQTCPDCGTVIWEYEKMTLAQCKIGQRFFMSGKTWLCTDIGTRTIAAIELTQAVQDDPSWLNGPPYAVAETVIDEDDMKACSFIPPTPAEQLAAMKQNAELRNLAARNKFIATFKTPDALYEPIKEMVKRLFPDTTRTAAYDEIYSKVSKWVSSGEYITIEFDIAEKTATVLPK